MNELWEGDRPSRRKRSERMGRVSWLLAKARHDQGAAGIRGLGCQERCKPVSAIYRSNLVKYQEGLSAWDCEEPNAQALRRRERVWKLTRPHSSNQIATGEPPDLSHLRRLAWVVSGFRWGRLTIVAGGFTSTQGAWESHVHGQRVRGIVVQSRIHTEVLDLMVDVIQELGHLNKLIQLTMLESRIQRWVVRPVWRRLGGNVPQ